MSNEDKGQAYGWDELAIENPNEGGEFTLLQDGKYPFRVVKMERGRFEGSAKMCACPMAVLYLEVDGGQLGSTTIKNNLHLNRKVEGIICSFFTCIGLRKSGDPLVFDWNKVPGSSGWAKVGTRTYNEKQYNEIKAFIEAPDPTLVQAARAAVAASHNIPTASVPYPTDAPPVEEEIPFD